jgi:hypothetical protein
LRPARPGHAAVRGLSGAARGGGTGLLFTESCYVSQAAKARPYQLPAVDRLRASPAVTIHLGVSVEAIGESDLTCGREGERSTLEPGFVASTSTYLWRDGVDAPFVGIAEAGFDGWSCWPLRLGTVAGHPSGAAPSAPPRTVRPVMGR